MQNYFVDMQLLNKFREGTFDAHALTYSTHIHSTCSTFPEINTFNASLTEEYPPRGTRILCTDTLVMYQMQGILLHNVDKH